LLCDNAEIKEYLVGHDDHNGYNENPEVLGQDSGPAIYRGSFRKRPALHEYLSPDEHGHAANQDAGADSYNDHAQRFGIFSGLMARRSKQYRSAWR